MLSIWILAALTLDFRQIVQHARRDQRHNHGDDCDNDEHFNQSEPSLAIASAARASQPTCLERAETNHVPYLYDATIWLTESNEVMTETISPPTMMLIPTMAAGPATPIIRSKLRCSFAS